ncbi:hypothetical protein O3G_MSEX005097 [Manduca sexta]|uniref:Uncharacterized protein n=1 Tax=Manduca sexta TaxID=7130 RepID=A0A922CI31_MANSE|nr:hypothetical protein O3G_MSEX005097 [Manduca sexta]
MNYKHEYRNVNSLGEGIGHFVYHYRLSQLTNYNGYNDPQIKGANTGCSPNAAYGSDSHDRLIMTVGDRTSPLTKEHAGCNKNDLSPRYGETKSMSIKSMTRLEYEKF